MGGHRSSPRDRLDRSGAEAGVYLASLEDPVGRRPRWRANGEELFFAMGRMGEVQLMAVSIKADAQGGLQVGGLQKLFETRVRLSMIQNNSLSYAPHPDGQRFLVNVMARTAERTVAWSRTGPRRESRTAGRIDSR